MNINLFQKNIVTLASGVVSDFKIECDALTDVDIECAAYLISKKVRFFQVFGVPKGGIRLEKALEKYAENDATLPILICDDVYTTGGSIESFYNKIIQADAKFNIGISNKDTKFIGFVIFARRHIKQEWIKTLFLMPE